MRAAWRRLAPFALAAAMAVAVWWPLSMARGFVPSPPQVLEAFVDAVFGGELYPHLAATLRRVVTGWVAAVLLGTAFGVLMGRLRAAEGIAMPWVMVGLALPGPVVILFSLLLFGLEESSVLIALVVSVTPFVVNFVYQGVRSIEPALQEMGRVYRLSPSQRLREVILPQVAPSVMAAARFGFALSWKLVVIIEALSRSDGIGAQLELFFRLLRVDQVLAWTFTFTVVMVVVELVVFRTAERRLFRWRREAALA